MGKRRPNAGRKRWPETKARPLTFKGWLSTDEDEIRRREWRGRTEVESVLALDERFAPFGNYRVASSSGSAYTVEIRSLRERINSCECQDYRINRLGTCKHIEGGTAPSGRHTRLSCEGSRGKRAHRGLSRRTQ